MQATRTLHTSSHNSSILKSLCHRSSKTITLVRCQTEGSLTRWVPAAAQLQTSPWALLVPAEVHRACGDHRQPTPVLHSQAEAEEGTVGRDVAARTHRNPTATVASHGTSSEVVAGAATVGSWEMGHLGPPVHLQWAMAWGLTYGKLATTMLPPATRIRMASRRHSTPWEAMAIGWSSAGQVLKGLDEATGTDSRQATGTMLTLGRNMASRTPGAASVLPMASATATAVPQWTTEVLLMLAKVAMPTSRTMEETTRTAVQGFLEGMEEARG